MKNYKDTFFLSSVQVWKDANFRHFLPAGLKILEARPTRCFSPEILPLFFSQCHMAQVAFPKSGGGHEFYEGDVPGHVVNLQTSLLKSSACCQLRPLSTFTAFLHATNVCTRAATSRKQVQDELVGCDLWSQPSILPGCYRNPSAALAAPFKRR